MPAKLLKLTLMVAAIVGLFGLIFSAPINPYPNSVLEKPKHSLNATEQSIVQQCLYYGPLVSEFLFGTRFPTAFCKSLHSPELGDPAVKVSLLSPRELLMRQHFYQEAAYLWSLYFNVSYCALRPTGPAAEQCLNTTGNGTAAYKGLFPKDFNSRKYLLMEKMSEAVVRYNPAMSDLEHCFHLHNRHPKPQFYQASKRYNPCRRFNTFGWSIDHLRAAAVSTEEKKAWRERAANRHFELRVSAGQIVESGQEEEEKPKMSWAQMEDQLYSGLYNSSDLIFGPSNTGRKEDWQLKNSLLFRNWHTDILNEELKPQEWRLLDHLKSNKIVDRAYDCWKFHLNEQMPWCRGVTTLDWGENWFNGFQMDYLTGLFDYNSNYTLKVREFIEAERMAEQEAIDDVSAHLLAFLALPEKIITYCRFDRLLTEEDFHLGEVWDEDCLEGGVYGHFFEHEEEEDHSKDRFI